MFKNTLIIISIIILSLSIIAFNKSLNLVSKALSNAAYELEPKFYEHYSFKQPEARLLEKDFYDEFIKEVIDSAVVSLINNKYETKVVDTRRVISLKEEFELSYKLSPIEKNPTNKDFYNCYQGVPIESIEYRYYSIPVLSNEPKPKIIPNQFRVVPQFAVSLDYRINQPEDNYNFFKFENNEVTQIIDKNEIVDKTFGYCLTTTSGQYANGSREGIDIIYTLFKPENKDMMYNIIKRSIFGNEDRPSVDIDIENRRIVAIKTNSQPKDETKTNNLFTFLFYGIPGLAIIYFAFRILRRLKK